MRRGPPPAAQTAIVNYTVARHRSRVFHFALSRPGPTPLDRLRRMRLRQEQSRF